MVTVALVGEDGAGKSTVTRSLEKSAPFSVKYLYMGPSILSSEKILPTTRLAQYIKLRQIRKQAIESNQSLDDNNISHVFHYEQGKRSSFWLALRLLNRIAQASYHQILSLKYLWGDHVVVYDRFYFFSVNYPAMTSDGWNNIPLIDRLEYLFFKYCYPKPDLVIYLDAPAEILYSRKKESSIQRIKTRKEISLELGKSIKNFVIVDASQPIDKVLEEVTQLITQFLKSKNRRDRSNNR